MSLVARARKSVGVDQSQMGVESQYGSYNQFTNYGGTYIPLTNLQQWTGLGVSPETALNIITVYQCVRILSETFASLPLILYRRLPEGGKERATDHPLYHTFHDQPNPDMTSFVWRELMMSHLATWGNAYNERVINGLGELELWPLRPDRMQVRWDVNGRKEYTYVYPTGRRVVIPPAKMFHVPGLSSNGLVGMSPISLMRSTISLMKTAEDFGENVFRNGARPAVILSHPRNLSEPAIQRLATQMDTLRGSGNSGKTVVMEEGLSVQEVGFPPEDAQFMQTRLFQKREIAAGYRIPAHKVGDLERATFSNIEHLSIEFIQDTMLPWFVRFEQEAETQLMPDEEDLFPEFLVDGYLRGDAKARAEAMEIRFRNSTLNADDWRAAENENPLPDGLGQQYFVPVNYASINPPVTESQPVAPTVSRETITESGSAPAGGPPVQPPQLTVIKSASEFRCPECHAKLAEFATPGTQIRCGRCKVIREVKSTGLELGSRRREIERDAAGRIIAVVDVPA